MKSSHFKQVLKSCKDGIAMTIHRLPGNREDRSRKECEFSSSESYQQKPPNEFFQSYQAPGTPGSTMSESSAGYHSAHSLPSVYSTAVSPGGEEVKTGQTGLTGLEVEPISTSARVNSRSSGSQYSQQSGYETDQTGLELPSSHRYRASSTGSSGFARSSPRSLQTEFYSGRSAYQRSSYRTGHTGLTTPKSDAPNIWYPRGTSMSRSYGRNNRFSASYDHLDTDHYPQPRSHDRSHDDHVTVTTPIHPRQALSLSNMHSNFPKHTHL